MVSEQSSTNCQTMSSSDRSITSDENNKGESSKQKSPTNLNFKLPIKLDRNNYNFWKLQVLAAVRAFDLEDFVLNPSKCPPRFVQTRLDKSEEIVQLLNEEHLIWKKTDKLLVCWLFLTLSESIFGQVTHCTIAYGIWKTLENLFAQQSKARALQLRHEIQNTKKGNLTISEYVLKMKTISESLAAAGQALSEEE